MIKIWQMNDCDWVAAETVDDARKAMRSIYEAADDLIDEPRIITDDEMDKTMFNDNPENPKKGRRRTFRAELERRIAEGEAFPQFFATSEY